MLHGPDLPTGLEGVQGRRHRGVPDGVDRRGHAECTGSSHDRHELLEVEVGCAGRGVEEVLPEVGLTAPGRQGVEAAVTDDLERALDFLI